MGLSGKKLLLLGFVVVLLVVIPLTVYLVQQQQKLKAAATPATTIAFVPQTQAVNVGDTFFFDISLNPGTNQISFVKLTINYDATKLDLVPTVNYLSNNCGTHSLCPNTAIFPSPPLQGPTETSGSASVTLSVGPNTANIITQNQSSIARITFKAKAQTTTPTQVSFAGDPNTQALSIGSTDQFNENVISSSQPASVTIGQGGASPSPSPSTTPAGKVPVCTSLNLDKGATGTAPFTINFTAIGGETGGTITKVTFNWGDGPAQTVTETGSAGGGIGTASVQTQLVHIYNNPGTYTATATLSDGNNNVSAIGPCTQTITVNAASTTSSGGSTGGGSTGGGGTGGGTTTTQTVTVSTPAPTSTPTPTEQPGVATTKGGLPAAGPGDNIVSFGTLGIISTIVGALLLFGL